MSPPCIVLAIEACRLLRNRFQGFLCSVLDTRDIGLKLEDIPIVRYFLIYFKKIYQAY